MIERTIAIILTYLHWFVGITLLINQQRFNFSGQPQGIAPGVLNLSHNWFIFHSIFILWGGNGGQAGDKIWGCIEFIGARLPTLQILGEKKVIKIPEI